LLAIGGSKSVLGMKPGAPTPGVAEEATRPAGPGRPSIEQRGITGLQTLKTEPTNSIAKDDAVRASVAAMRRAQAAAESWPENRTVASDGVKTLNGFAGSVPDGYVRVSPEDVRDYSLKIGHDLQSKGARDQQHTPRGFPGLSRATDAEKQLGLAAPNHPIGVSRPMCNDCQGWYQSRANWERRPFIVTDPEYTRIFWPRGTGPEEIPVPKQ
jgi:hypothetical protein